MPTQASEDELRARIEDVTAELRHYEAIARDSPVKIHAAEADGAITTYGITLYAITI